MPYPDEMGGTAGSTQRDETLSETEKHWNQVILAFLAIGTTVLGVTLVVYARSGETPGPRERVQAGTGHSDGIRPSHLPGSVPLHRQNHIPSTCA